MITGRRSSFEKRCVERGYDIAAAWACVVQEMGPVIVVDETHPAYPRERAPSLLKKAANFTKAVVQHVAAGAPQCTDEQIAARFAICQGCEHYDGKACLKCGCPVVREKNFVSKLSWADQSCPVGKWGPVARDG